MYNCNCTRYLTSLGTKSKDKKAVLAALKQIYHSPTVQAAEQTLDEFANQWSAKYPSVERSWRNHWDNLITLFDYPAEIRKIIYTTNAIESLNSVIRKSIRNRKIFPSAQSALKIVYLAIKKASAHWTMLIRNWIPAMNRLAIEYENRFDVEEKKVTQNG